MHEPVEYPLCAVCDTGAYDRLVVRKGHQMVRCRQCGLVYMSPRPRNEEQFHALYTNHTYCARQIRHASSPKRMREAHWRLDQVEQHAAGRGRLLDVGCSAASFLVAARDRGWNVAGLDVSRGAIEHATSVHGLSASIGTLEDARFPSGSFDVVTLFECIEHMARPARALEAAARLLRPDGLLVITTPNIDGLVPRVTYHLLARTIGAWEHPTPPHHLYQFSRRTLTALLERTGFRVVAHRTRPMGLRYTAKQMQSAILDALKRRYGWSAPASASLPAGTGQSAPGAATTVSLPWAASRRAVRNIVAAFSWGLTLALYAFPVRRFGLGDAMLVVARKP